MPVDLRAIAAHRDDVELTCAGTLLKASDQGHRTGILNWYDFPISSGPFQIKSVRIWELCVEICSNAATLPGRSMPASIFCRS